MLDKVDYYKHKLYEPPYYHRQYETDLPQDQESSSYTETAKRAAHIALPFLSMYQPLGKAISIAMGSVRVITSTTGVVGDNLVETSYRVMQVALALLALAGTLYHFTLGLYLTTGADIISNLTQILEALYRHEYQKAGEELLQALSSGIYLAIMMTGSLEVVLASILIQALISFYQARDEWSKGRMPEAFAKTILGMVRLVQAGGQIQIIQRRNTLLKRYEELAERINNGRKIDHLWAHPLIQAAYGQKGAVLEDAQGNVYDMGSHFHGHGKQIVKGMNVTFKDHGDYTTLDFKVNHVFRDRLEKTITDLAGHSKADLKELLGILGSHATNISVSKGPSDFADYVKNHEIKLEGIGKISVGASKDVLTLYDKVSIRMEKGKSLYDFHEALSFLNLDDALRQSANEDVERMKMGQLFRMFSPQAATLFERSDPFFDLSLEDFKKQILLRSPEMGAIFDKYLSKMELREIVPGRMRYAVDGLSDELTKKGALGLTSALTGAWSQKEIHERVASILKMGMIASEMRRDHQVGKPGLSSGSDYYTGGADSVFTQVVTDRNKSYNEYMYHSDVRFLISPKVLETGTYQYHDDNFGTREITNSDWWFWKQDYLDRDNIFKFLATERANFQGDNEVMLKERVAPEYITGIVVKNQHMKNQLLDYLRQSNIVQKDASGNETILSRAVDQFIYVGNTVKAEQFA